MQVSLFAGALERREARTVDVTSIDEALDAAQDGFARLAWDVVQGEGEAKLKQGAVTVRCLQRADGSIPVHERESDLVAFVAKSY